jgi:hypothetical protein
VPAAQIQSHAHFHLNLRLFGSVLLLLTAWVRKEAAAAAITVRGAE